MAVKGGMPVKFHSRGEEIEFAPPRLVVEEETVHVGEVPKGETRKATFLLRNVGDATLKILRAKPG